MNYSIRYNEATDVVEIKFKGDVDYRAVIQSLQEIVDLLVERQCFKLLKDLREATLSISIGEIYHLPSVLEELSAQKGLNPKWVRRAILVDKKNKVFSFYETVFYNRGHRSKVFLDPQEADQWLHGKRQMVEH